MLPDSWIERIFQKFEDLYGAKWAAQYGDFPRERVKRTWAEELAGFADIPDAISRALTAQKVSPYPPTLPEFLGLCREAAKRIQPAMLALPAVEMTPEQIEANRAKLRLVTKRESTEGSLSWAEKLRARFLRGETLHVAQISMASEALGEDWRLDADKSRRICVPAVQAARAA